MSNEILNNLKAEIGLSRKQVLKYYLLWKYSMHLRGAKVTFHCLWQEHTVIESKPDHFLDDLRLNNPWPELKRYRVVFLYLVF